MDIGIDLGTSNSAIAGLVDGKLRIFRPADGGEVLPSLIYFDPTGLRLFGRRAHDLAWLNPERVASGFKRLLGTRTPLAVSGLGLELGAEECSAEIIRQLLAQAETLVGKRTIREAVITIPAAFNQLQSEATLRAAELAGLTSVSLLQEPIAAAIASLDGERKSGQFLVYDLGGGTFDLALVQSLQGEANIIAHRGINMLGGRDFDRMIVNEIVRPWLAEHYDLPEQFQRDDNYRRLIRVSQLAAEKAKIDLSAQTEVHLFASAEEVRLMDLEGRAIHIDITLSRQRYEELIREPVTQTVELIRMVLDEQGYQPGDIDRIVFIGGPSKTPLVREMVSHELGIAPDLKTDPMLAVAIGAAFYAGWRGQQAAAQAIPTPRNNAAQPAPERGPAPVSDIAPAPDARLLQPLLGGIPAAHTIALKVRQSLDEGRNRLEPLVQKGTMLPIQGQQRFQAAKDLTAGQPDLLAFELFQVEYPERVELNLCIGLLQISGTDLPAGVNIRSGDLLEFHWQMNDSGILRAQLRLPSLTGGDAVSLATPRFYSPQAAEQSFAGGQGEQLARALLKQAQEELDELAAVLGAAATMELGLMNARIEEQKENLGDEAGDPEGIRRVCEEARFIRQDLARTARPHRGKLLARQVDRLRALFEAQARPHANGAETARFGDHRQRAEQLCAGNEASQFADAERHLRAMRDIFFGAAWRDAAYVQFWFERLVREPFLFPDRAEFEVLQAAGREAIGRRDQPALRKIVSQLLDSRVHLVASDHASDPANIARAA